MEPKEEGLFNSDFLKWAWEKVHGKYRQPDQTLHGGPADTAGATDDGTGPTGAASLTSGHLPAIPIAGAGHPVTGLVAVSGSIDAAAAYAAQMQQLAAMQNTVPGVTYTVYGQPSAIGPAYWIGGGNSWVTMNQAKTEPVKTAPIPNEGIRLGEVTAWRCWRVECGFLRAMFFEKALWTPGEPMKGIVGEGLSSGVHAWNSERGSIEYGTDFLKADRYSMIVFGRVALWGDIIEYEKGYRAEYGRVIGLDYLEMPRTLAPAIRNDASSEVLDLLCERYGVKGK